MPSAFRLSISVAGLALLLSAQAPPRPSDGAFLNLVMERSEGGAWKALDPQTVLNKGDSLRFRIESSFPGYLYAYYRGSADESAWLYPTPNSGMSNRIEVGTSYLIPSSTTSYMVSGKPGFDIVYWLLSPKPISGKDWLPSDDEHVTRTVLPRCREEIDAATTRGCLDRRAGAVEIAKAPEGLKARELRLNTSGETTRIEAAEGPGLVVYEFRIAHR